MYRTLFRLVLARLDPEDAHRMAFALIRLAGRAPFGGLLSRITRPRTDLSVRTLGHSFPTPFGVAAGFDKDGKALLGLGAFGFGHVEVGTVTAIPQQGSPRPRLFRLIPDRAVINRMGFNNAGSAAAARRLKRIRSVRNRPVIGANIGKSRSVAGDDVMGDYVFSARRLAAVADYLVVNVSSPNTPGLRDLQTRDRLEPLLTAVREASGTTPVLVKITGDLPDEDIADVARLVVDLDLAGLVVINTTVSRDGLQTSPEIVANAGAGGLSGPPLAARALEVLSLVRSIVPDTMCVISVGGVETAADVAARLTAGATLVQGYTGFVYRGPFWARQINRGLERLSPRSEVEA